MKTPESSAFPTLLRRLPEPARMLRIGRLLIPLCILVGLIAEPVLYWLIPFLSALSLPFSL